MQTSTPVHHAEDPDVLLGARIKNIVLTCEGGLEGFFERLERKRRLLESADRDIDRMVGHKLVQQKRQSGCRSGHGRG